jgi:sialidase-1
MKKIIFLLNILFISCETQKSDIIDLFNAENDPNVSCYRIPSIMTAVNGDLIAMIDERVPSCGDLKWSRDINIVMRKSLDNGKTWSEMETIVDYPLGQSASDPSMILDGKNQYNFYVL